MKYLDILIKLRKINRSINLESKRIEKAMGISIPQMLVLQYLSEMPGYRATSKEIKLYVNLNASTVSGIISRLESKHFVARLSNVNDRRTRYITMTASGHDLLKRSPDTLEERLSRKLRALQPEKIAELNRNIDLLIRLMDADDADLTATAREAEVNSAAEN